MVLCAAFGCDSLSGRHNVNFFSFPKDRELRNIWCTKIGRTCSDGKQRPYLPNKNSRVCSLHFEDDQFVPTLAFLKAIGYNHRIMRKLKGDAVPTIFTTSKSNADPHKRSESTEIKLKKGKTKKVKPHKKDCSADSVQSDSVQSLSGTKLTKKRACPPVSDLTDDKPVRKPSRRILHPSKTKIYAAENINELVSTPQPDFHDYLGPIEQLSAEEKLKKATEHIEELDQLLDRLTDKQRSTEQSGRKSSVLEEERDPDEPPNKQRKCETQPSNKTYIPPNTKSSSQTLNIPVRSLKPAGAHQAYVLDHKTNPQIINILDSRPSTTPSQGPIKPPNTKSSSSQTLHIPVRSLKPPRVCQMKEKYNKTNPQIRYILDSRPSTTPSPDRIKGKLLHEGRDEMHAIQVSVATNIPNSVREHSTQTPLSKDQAEAIIIGSSNPTQNRRNIINSAIKEQIKDSKKQPRKPIIDLYDAKMEISKVLSVLNLSKEKFKSLLDWMKSFKFQEEKQGEFFLKDGDSRGLIIQYTDNAGTQKQNQTKLNRDEITPSSFTSVKQQDPAVLKLNDGQVFNLVDKVSSPGTDAKPRNLVVQQGQQPQQMILLMPMANGAMMPNSATNTSNVTLIPLQTISSVSSLNTATVPCVVSSPSGGTVSCVVSTPKGFVSSSNIPLEERKIITQEEAARRGSLKRKPPSSSCKPLSFFASKARKPFQMINSKSVRKEVYQSYKMGDIAVKTEVVALKDEDLPIKNEPDSLEKGTSCPVPMHLYRSNNHGGEAEETPTIEMVPVYFSDIKHETMEEVGPERFYMASDKVENTNIFSHNEGTSMIKIESVSFNNQKEEIDEVTPLSSDKSRNEVENTKLASYNEDMTMIKVEPVSFCNNQKEEIDEVAPFSSDKSGNEVENTKLASYNEDMTMIKTEPVSFSDNEEESMEESSTYISSKDQGNESIDYERLNQLLKSEVLPDPEDEQFDFVIVKSEPPDDY